MSFDLYNPDYFFNRELSWLKFNERVLEEAQDDRNPLLERLKFLSIFSSNLDEFFMIRVAGVKEQIHAEIRKPAADGLHPSEVLSRLASHTHELVDLQSSIMKDDILPKLNSQGIRLREIHTLRAPQRVFIEDFFKEHIYPLLTPLAVDPTHPFPQLKGLGLNLLIELIEPDLDDITVKDIKIAVLHIPSSLPRFIHIPHEDGNADFVLVEEVIEQFIYLLFPKMIIRSVDLFRFTRNADLILSEAEADDLLKLIERELLQRRLGTVIRLEVSESMNSAKRSFLKEMANLEDQDIYIIPTLLDLTACMSLLKLDFPQLKDKPFTPMPSPRFLEKKNMFRVIREGDLLLHHPYESFNHVVDFVSEAAEDPKVLAIKQTLYRTSGDSPIVAALKTAVENGKQVTALIELKARFDEKNNIQWARELDRSGVNVVYGVMGLKTHCKITMVIRQEEDQIRRYLHLSTGNYNATTARIYTDLSLMTCNPWMGEDASGLFNLLTGYSLQQEWNKFLIAPATLRSGISKYIQQCIDNHKIDQPSRIILVLNSLVDPDMIRQLYEASMAGVQVDLIIRGICSLKPGVPGLSHNITVKSIVGRFLEHTRIFYFKHNGESKIFLGSADLMDRNLNRRVELVFPVEDPDIKLRVRSIIQHMLDDRAKSRYLDSDGNYTRTPDDTEIGQMNVQEFLLAEAEARKKVIPPTLLSEQRIS